MHKLGSVGRHRVLEACVPRVRVKLLFAIFAAMPIQMLVDLPAALASGGTDLKFLLAREGVSDEFQAKLFVAGVQNVRQFGVLASSTDDMRDLLKTEFELSTENGMGQRVQISKILVAWDHARQRSSKEAEAAAAAAVAETAKPLPLGEVDGMRTTF